MANLCTLARGRPASTVVTVDAEPALFEVPAAETNRPIGLFNPLTVSEAAEKAGVAVKTMQRAIEVDRKGSPELIDAVKRGDIAVSAAAKVETNPQICGITLEKTNGQICPLTTAAPPPT